MTEVQLGEAHLIRVEPRFAEPVAKFGPCTLHRTIGREETFEVLASSIVSQQLSGKAAATIWGRLEALCGGQVSAEAVLKQAPDSLRSAGLSGAKSSYLAGLAQAELPSMNDLATLPEDEIIERLTVHRGIGRWSVEMLLIFRLGRLDVWPTDDLGVQKGFQKLLALSDRPKPRAMVPPAEPWRPYRSIAAWYCWRLCESGD